MTTYFDDFDASKETLRLPDFRYEEIKMEVANLLGAFGKFEIPLDVFKLAGLLGIRLVKYSYVTQAEWECFERHGISSRGDGFLAVAKKEWGKIEVPFIYYNDSKNAGRIRFTISHEIGHYVLGHTQESLNAEAEANFFAKYLLAPPAVVDLINPTDFMEIKDKFCLSPECAMNVFNYYQKWLRHHSFVMEGRLTEYEEKLKNCFTYRRVS